MFSKIFLSALVGLAAAYTQPTGDAPVGNPISQPGLNSIVPVGEGFTITWNPTTKGTVTLLLLKGPSENAVPQYPIVEKTENDGSYVWTPSADLEPTTGATGYGIQLIDDATGQYQYTTQFGISNPNYKKASSAPSYDDYADASSSSTSQTMEHPTAYAPKPHAPTSTSTKAWVTGTGYVPKPTGFWTPSSNVTMVAPTGYKPSTVTTKTSAAATTAPSATYEGPSQQTGAASSNVVARSFFGLVAAAGVAALAI